MDIIRQGFKLFRQDKDGNLRPLYVRAKDIIPVNEWVFASDAVTLDENGKVKAKMRLKFRPGFHIAGSKPEAPQITNQAGCVWCKVEYIANIDYNPEAQENGRNKNGKVIPVKADLNHLPTSVEKSTAKWWKRQSAISTRAISSRSCFQTGSLRRLRAAFLIPTECFAP